MKNNRITRRSFCRCASSACVALLFAVVSHTVFADTISWVPRPYDMVPTVVVQRPAAKKQVFGVDDKGNVMLHNGSTAMVLVYEPDCSSEAEAGKERAGLALPRKESSGFGGLSVLLAFTF